MGELGGIDPPDYFFNVREWAQRMKNVQFADLPWNALSQDSIARLVLKKKNLRHFKNIF
jgi:hypothetical protein